MAQNYDLEIALPALLGGSLILLPTDTVWSVGCDAGNEQAVAKLRELRLPDDKLGLELLVHSLEMLRHYVGRLHPRIETLLLYHMRPLTIVYNEVRHLPANLPAADGSLAIRLVHDPYCRKLIQSLARPVATLPADLRRGYYPINFGAISSDVIEQVDYVSRYRRADKATAQPSVMAKLSPRDELEFLRD
jgi:L-threonylcarbamoyladenylate synthase